MGDLVGDAERAIRAGLDATHRASKALDAFDGHEVAASVGKAVDAAAFSLTEALRRLGR